MFTPFDGNKTLYHIHRWSQMEEGRIPAPVLVTIDPIHRCNLNCSWCNSGRTINNEQGESLTKSDIQELPGALKAWGVKAICIAGGGEPLLHPHCSELITGLVESDIEVGVVTNGILLSRHIEALGRCRWVGVSVDAGTALDYKTQKGADKFLEIIGNIKQLRSVHPELEITYKYLIHPGNMHGLYKAACLAKEIGCTYFHARPAGLSWQELQHSPRRSHFTEGDVRVAVHLLDACAELSDPPKFKVVNTPDKFKQVNWGIQHGFKSCHAIGMTCVIQANHTLGLCCDRRGDPKLTLCSWHSPADFITAWGSERHKNILKSIDINNCPRCTYTPHNRLYEAFVCSDESCKWFI